MSLNNPDPAPRFRDIHALFMRSTEGLYVDHLGRVGNNPGHLRHALGWTRRAEWQGAPARGPADHPRQRLEHRQRRAGVRRRESLYFKPPNLVSNDETHWFPVFATEGTVFPPVRVALGLPSGHPDRLPPGRPGLLEPGRHLLGRQLAGQHRAARGRADLSLAGISPDGTRVDTAEGWRFENPNGLTELQGIAVTARKSDTLFFKFDNLCPAPRATTCACAGRLRSRGRHLDALPRRHGPGEPRRPGGPGIAGDHPGGQPRRPTWWASPWRSPASPTRR